MPKKGFGLPLGQILKTDLKDWAEDIFFIKIYQKTNILIQLM